MFTRVAVAFLLVGLSAAQDNIFRMEDVIQSYVSSKTFMGSVLVARGDKIILSTGYGFANLEWQVADTPDTKYRLGSITKQFTAACILLLAVAWLLTIMVCAAFYARPYARYAHPDHIPLVLFLASGLALAWTTATHRAARIAFALSLITSAAPPSPRPSVGVTGSGGRHIRRDRHRSGRRRRASAAPGRGRSP